MFEEKGISADVVLSDLRGVLQEDCTYESGRPVASMSTTPHQLGVRVLVEYLEKNAGRLHTFQGSAQIEREVVGMIADLLSLENPYGTTTSGGTESNILAMLSFREYAKRKTDSPEVIVPKNAHSSVDKAAWLLGVRLRKSPVDKEFKALPGGIERAITKDTVGIVATAGTTYLGQIDPIEKIGAIAEAHELPLHVDAAFGAFVIPFLRDLGLGNFTFDFSVSGVTSISADPHKMGLAPIPSGCIVFRNKKHLDTITLKVPYLGGISSKQSTILATRSASSILSTWAIMKHLGRSGYRTLVSQCMKTTRLAVERAHANPELTLPLEPVMNILGLGTTDMPLDHVVDRMEERGWSMAISPFPRTMRVVVMPHVTESVVNEFFNDLDKILT